MSIIDATANIGVSTYYLAKVFKKVYAIELVEETFNYLNNNVKIFIKSNQIVNNIEVFHDDCIKISCKLPSNVIFIDPPWTGINYKFKDNISLNLSDMSLDKVISLFKKKYIFIKAPYNFNVSSIYDISYKIEIFNLKKIIIIKIEL